MKIRRGPLGDLKARRHTERSKPIIVRGLGRFSIYIISWACNLNRRAQKKPMNVKLGGNMAQSLYGDFDSLSLTRLYLDT